MSRMKVINSFWPAGDGSTLNLNFTQMSTLADLTSRGLTFSRSTSGTYLNANGLVATATAGNPRFDYDTSGNPRGILLEGSATNLVYHSETFRLNAVAAEPYWAESASVSRGTDTAPDGTANAAVNFIATGTAGTVNQTSAVGTSANRTFSFWARRNGGGTVEYTLDNGTTWTAVTITASWVRYTATATNANQRVGFRVATGTGTSIWGAQLENGIGSSSYVTSGASQGTRAQDQMQLASLSALNYSQTVGTFVIDGHWYKDATTAAYPRSIRFQGSFQSMAVITNGKTLFGNSTNSTGGAYFESSRVLSGNNIPFKFAFSLSAVPTPTNAISHVGLNGSVTTITPAVASPALIALPTSLDFMYSAADATYYPAFTMKSFKYWPQYKTAAEVTTLTT